MTIYTISHCGTPVASVKAASIPKAFDAAWKLIGTMSLQDGYYLSCNHDWSVDEG